MLTLCEIKSTEHPCARLPMDPTDNPYSFSVSSKPVNEPHIDSQMLNKTENPEAAIGKPVSHFEQSSYYKQLNQPRNPKTKSVCKYSSGRLKIRRLGSSLKNIVGLSQQATDRLQILQRTLWINQQTQNQWIKQATQKLILNEKRLELLQAEVQLIRRQYCKLELTLSCRKNENFLNEASTD